MRMNDARRKILRFLVNEQFEPSALSIHIALNLSISTIYTHLYLMERYKLVSSRWLAGPYPRTRVYAITDAGRKALE